MKWTLAAALAVVLAFGTAAAEEKVLNCTDADANGFKWENLSGKRESVRTHRCGRPP